MRFGRRSVHSTAGTPTDTNWQSITSGTSTVAAPLFGVQLNPNGTSTLLTDAITNLGIKVWRSAPVSWASTASGIGAVESPTSVLTWSGTQLTDYEKFVDAGNSNGCASILNWKTMSSGGLYPNQYGADPHGSTTGQVAFSAATAFAVAHLGTKVNRYEVLNELGSTVQFEVDALYNSYLAIKGAYSSATVGGWAVLDPNPAIPAGLQDRCTKTPTGTSVTWETFSDVWTFHRYAGVPNSALHLPENMWARSRDALTTIETYRTNTRVWITETAGWPQNGSFSTSQTSAGDYTSRYFFMVRCHPRVEIVSYYELVDEPVFQQGLYTSGLVQKVQGAVYGEVVPILHTTSSGRFYQHATSDVLAVSLRMNDGTNRLVLWGNTWKSATGSNDGTDTTGTIVFTGDCTTSGTLTTKIIGGSSTSTSLASGANTLSIPYTGRASILSATCPISFRGLSPV